MALHNLLTQMKGGNSIKFEENIYADLHNRLFKTVK